MSLHHSDPAVERLAAATHWVWAVISAMSALYAISASYMMFDLAMHSTGFAGRVLFGQLLLQYALIVLGVGGAIFHVWGALNHHQHLRELAKR